MKVKFKFLGTFSLLTIGLMYLSLRIILPVTDFPTVKFHRFITKRQSPSLRPGQTNANLVLLVAYLRGGSTFTADLIQNAEDSFYLFEPLMHFVKNFHLRPLLWCKDSEALSRECSDLRTNEEAIRQIEQFYRCNITADFLTPEVPRGVVRSETQRRLGHCLRHRQGVKKTKEECYKSIQTQCEYSNLRLIKTIRLSMELTMDLMTKLPKLKIVHLIRDPRGMIASRLSLINRKLQNLFILSAKDICYRSLRDVRAARMMSLQFPNRIKTVKYEDLAENPYNTSKELLEFLGLNFSPRLQKWISDHTRARTNNHYFGTKRANSSLVAHKWKRSLTLDAIKEIDQWCVPFYNTVGYEIFNYEKT